MAEPLNMSVEGFLKGLRDSMREALESVLGRPTVNRISTSMTVAANAPSTTELLRWGPAEAKHYDVLVLQATTGSDIPTGTYVPDVTAEIQFGSDHSDMSASAVVDVLGGLAVRLPGDRGSVRIFNSGVVPVKVSGILSRGNPFGEPRYARPFSSIAVNAVASVTVPRYAKSYYLVANYPSGTGAFQVQQVTGSDEVTSLQEWSCASLPGGPVPLQNHCRTLRVQNNCLSAASGDVIFYIGI